MSNKHEHMHRAARRRIPSMAQQTETLIARLKQPSSKRPVDRRKPKIPAIAAKAANPTMPTGTGSYAPSAPITRQPTGVPWGQAFADTLSEIKTSDLVFTWGSVSLSLEIVNNKVIGTFTNALGTVFGRFTQLIGELHQLVKIVRLISRVKLENKMARLYNGSKTLGCLPLQTA